MNRCHWGSTIVRTLFAVFLFLSLPAVGAKTSQVEANHMRWENHDAVLANAIAWQEERAGQWVTVVLLTDRPVPREALVAGTQPGDLMEATKVQGLAFAVGSGGVPLPLYSFDIGFHDAGTTRTTTMNGAGGFEIDSQSATQIKGRVLFSPFTAGSRDKSAWSVSFDAQVLRGDPKRMAAEGEVLGAGGGQPGKDLQAAQQAALAMDYAVISAYASPELATYLQDSSKRADRLKMLKSMTPPQTRILGGLRNSDKARVYWVQQWPAALDNRCVDTLVLKDGKWRSIESACQSE